MKKKSKGKLQNKEARKEVTKKLNPFEVHVNRSKHQVLGRKLKSDQGLPGVSRTKALQKRKKTLLQEYKMKDKINQFIDQRIGERNHGMTEDDRIMARFTAERMRMFNKKAMFNLSDSEVLTHRGQTLSEIERFEDIRSDDDDEEDARKSGALKGKFVENAHFGGGMLTKNKQDRESLIDELINESKKRKAERQKNKEETLEATEQLDEEWKTLGSIVTSKPNDTGNESLNTQKNDEYDVVMRRLKFEPQAQASQRLKTDEEVAKEDKEQLEKLEQERLKQLREIEVTKYGNHRSADDLDDGFSYPTDGIIVDDSSSKNYQSESSGSSSESESEMDGEDDEKTCSDFNEEDDKYLKPEKKIKEKVQTVEDEPEGESNENEKTDVNSSEDHTLEDFDVELSDEEESAMDDLTDLMPIINEESGFKENVPTKQSLGRSSGDTKDEQDICTPQKIMELQLPYVLKVPDNYDSFKDLLNNRSVDQQNVIFERLIKSNHPSLDPGNKKRMLTLATFLVQLVGEGDVAWKALPHFVKYLILLKEFNKEECLKVLVDSILSKMDYLDCVPPSLAAIKSLVLYILVFLKPHGTDVLLPVNQPALSLACKLISQSDGGDLSTRYISISLLCCYLLQQDAKASSSVYTEPITFLTNCVKHSITRLTAESKSCKKSQNTSPGSQTSASHSLTNVAEDLKVHLENLDKDEVDLTDTQVLHCSVVLLAAFVKAYRKYPQSKILLKPVQNCLNQIKVDVLPETLNLVFTELQTLLEVLQSAKLSPLMKVAKRPKALRQYDPSFHTVTVGRSHKGLPAEVLEQQKLQHKYKQEMKGAMRELRRDRAFLANIKLKEKAQSDELRMKKVKEIFGSAAAQQGELRSLKRKK